MKKAIGLIFALAVITALVFISPFHQETRSSSNKQAEMTLEASAVPHGSESLPSAWHRSNLSSDEAVIYDQVEAGLRSLSSDISVVPCDVETLSKCYEAVLSDNPDMFWMDSHYEYQMTPTGTVMTLSPSYLISSPDSISASLHRYEDIAHQVVAGLPDDDYGKARGIYTWIADNCRYDENARQSQTIAGVFDDRSSACAGYARAFQYLCSYANIPCAYIAGRAVSENGGQDVSHAWNCVCIDGVVCYLDVTWGDRDDVAPVDYSWLGLTLSDMAKTHTSEESAPLPAANELGYEIWNRVQTFFRDFDKEALYKRLSLAVEARDATTPVRFGSSEAARQASQWLSDDKELTTKLMADYKDAFPDPSGKGLFGVYDEIGMDAMVIIWQF